MSGASANSSSSEIEPKVRRWQGVAYSLPVIGTTFLTVPVWTALPGIYAKYFGLALPVIATVMLVGRLFDAVTDPIVGYLTDIYRAKTGTRKPFVMVGGLLLIICAYFLYVPPEGVSAIYFLGWSFAFYLTWTVFQIPHLSWGGELTCNSTEKSKVYSFRAGALYLGLLLFYAVPLLPFFESTEITPETLQWSAIVAAFLLPLFLYLCMKLVPDGYNTPSVNEPSDNGSHAGKKKSLQLFLQAFIKNKPFLIFLGGYIFYGVSIGMWYGLIFIYVDVYLGLGSLFALAFMASFAISIPLIPVWYKVSAWLGKRNSWLIGTLFFTISCIYTAFLSPGETHFVELVTLKVINDLGFTCMEILAPSMLSDIVDYSTRKFRINRHATYFAVYVFVTKTALAVGAALGLAIAGGYGFNPASTTFTLEGVFGLKLAIAWIPAFVMLASMVFIVLTPITPRRHDIIRRRLECRTIRFKKASKASSSPKGALVDPVLP